MILEDDVDLAASYCNIIRSFTPHETLCFTSVESLVENNALDAQVAILDINLGVNKQSGIDAYRWLHDNKFTGKICFLTGHGSNHPQVREASKIEDAQVLTKPLPVSKFLKLFENGEAVNE